MKGIYKYTDLETGEIVYVGKDSHIDKNQHKHITSVSLEKLEEKVKAKGLKWKKFKEE